jgi:hypothetical protein
MHADRMRRDSGCAEHPGSEVGDRDGLGHCRWCTAGHCLPCLVQGVGWLEPCWHCGFRQNDCAPGRALARVPPHFRLVATPTARGALRERRVQKRRARPSLGVLLLHRTLCLLYWRSFQKIS